MSGIRNACYNIGWAVSVGVCVLHRLNAADGGLLRLAQKKRKIAAWAA
jgi:hypothetical protein